MRRNRNRAHIHVGTEDLKACQSENERPPTCRRPFKEPGMNVAAVPVGPHGHAHPTGRHYQRRPGLILSQTRKVSSSGAGGGEECCDRGGPLDGRTRYNLASELNGHMEQTSPRKNRAFSRRMFPHCSGQRIKKRFVC